MNTRKILIIAILFTPLAAVILLSQIHLQPSADSSFKSGSMSIAPVERPSTDADPNKTLPTHPPQNLDEAKLRLRNRLAELEKMSPEQWQQEQQDRIADKRDRLMKARQQHALEMQNAQAKQKENSEDMPEDKVEAPSLPNLNPQSPLSDQ